MCSRRGDQRMDDTASVPSSVRGASRGPPAVGARDATLFNWPIVTEEDEEAVIDVLRNENLSGTNITREFEADFARWQGTEHCLAYPNGTMAILAAIHAAGVRRGDELICPSMTFWGSCTQAMSLGAVRSPPHPTPADPSHPGPADDIPTTA